MMDIEKKIQSANEEVLRRWNESDLVLVGIARAEEIPGFHEHLILHAGPPISYEDMCAPMKGAVLTAAMFEGMADTREEAERRILEGEIELAPCHHFQCAGPMTGIVTRSMPLWKIVNTTFGNTAYSTINEGMGDVLRFGGSSPAVIRRLAWIRDSLAPLLQTALACADEAVPAPSPLQVMAKALHMGDELHMRNAASSSLWFGQLAPLLVKAAQQRNTSAEELNRIMRFLAVNNEQFFLNVGMASAKALADSAEGVPYSTVVHRLCRNGTEIGMQIASMPGKWFTAAADRVDGLFFSGYSREDANGDIGDSAIMEVIGVGGMAMGCSPAIVKFIGNWTAEQAIAHTRGMYEITCGASSKFQSPQLNGQGTPIGLDIVRVVQKGITPIINTAIIHKEAGRGMIGAGMARVPMELFERALIAFGEEFMPDETAEYSGALD